MRTEFWNGKPIRFLEVSNEWYSVGNDISSALGYVNLAKAVRDHVEDADKIMGVQNVTPYVLDELGRKQFPTLISEFGIYDLIFSSKMLEAKGFKRWTFSVLRDLRKSAGIEGYEVFRMTDPKIQNSLMEYLGVATNDFSPKNFIKANMIADKAVSNKFGFEKLIKKNEMTPEMLDYRQKVLKDVVDLMVTKEKYGLDVSVSKTIYQRAGKQDSKEVVV